MAKTKNKKIKNKPISNQMEMFAIGGLKQEGGSIDPVSGNDVPIGSTKEEVRDDIPAQLSEGEFVMPADVVRFHGLDKMMELRDQAKMGLQKMEAMGQMGNSDEATLPDNVPFGIDDIDMEDEPVEMAEGGVVKAANGTFMNPSTGIGGYQQSQFANYTPQYTPYVPTQLPTSSYIAPQQQKTPLASQQTLPDFKDVIPAPEGKYDEIIEYVNEEGLKLSIPFVNGKPIYPIPTGYKRVDTGVVAPDPITQVPTARASQSVQDTGDGGDNKTPQEIQADRERMAEVSARTAKARELGYKPQNPITGILGKLTPLGMFGVGKLQPGQYDAMGNISGKGIQDPRTFDPITGKVTSSGSTFKDITNAITGNDISNKTFDGTDFDPSAVPTEIQNNMVTPMTAAGFQQYSPQELISQITDAQKSLDVAKAEVERSNALGRVDDLSTGRRDTAQFGLGRVDDLSTGRRDSTRDPSRGSLTAQEIDQQQGFQSISDEEADIAGAGAGAPQATMSAQEAQSKGIEMGFEAHSVAPGTATNDAISQGPTQGNNAAPAGSQYSANGKFSSPEVESSDSSSECFTKGTKVKLYKGGTVAIEKLKKGDVVLGIYGQPNKVLGMDIHKVSNDNRPELVQMEGYKKPFITANHPFYKFTPVKNSIYGKNQNFGTGVLMSFNNKQNNQYHPWLGEVENAKEYFKYKKVLAKEGEMLYNLYLDGDHTHYANGLSVHNIVRNGHISFALFYKNYITAKQYEGDIEYVKGVKNRLIRLGYSKIAYPLAYQIINDTLLGKITAMLATPFVKAMAKSYQENKTSKLMKSLAYLFVYPTCYLRGLIGR